MAEEWRLESREKEKQIPPVTVREPISALVLQKWPPQSGITPLMSILEPQNRGI